MYFPDVWAALTNTSTQMLHVSGMIDRHRVQARSWFLPGCCSFFCPVHQFLTWPEIKLPCTASWKWRDPDMRLVRKEAVPKRVDSKAMKQSSSQPVRSEAENCSIKMHLEVVINYRSIRVLRRTGWHLTLCKKLALRAEMGGYTSRMNKRTGLEFI